MTPVHAVFLHGLANKPEAQALRRIWLEALAERTITSGGFDLGEEGVEAHFVYWADLFYPEPLSAVAYESAATELAAEAATSRPPPEDAWVRQMREHYPEAAEGAEEEEPPAAAGAEEEPPALADAPVAEDEIPADAPVDPDDPYERIPIPWFLKKRIMGDFLREAHDYLFDVDGLRQTIRRRVLDVLEPLPEDARVVLVGHSQGSFIAYDVLTLPSCRPVHGFLTLGSPLGVDEIQDHLDWTRTDGFPRALEGDWVNVYDPWDVVSRPDPRLANDFRKAGREVVLDVQEENWGRWRHSATKYLKGPKLRARLRRLCDREETP